MAEAIVSIATERVSSFLFGEATFLFGVREEVKRLLAELKRMRSFLIDASQKQNQDERVRNWVAEIRNIAYETEDIIDYFLLKAARRGVPICSFERITSPFKKGHHLYVVGNQIKSIRTKLGDIEKSMQIYGIRFADEGEGPSLMSEMQKQLRRSHPHKEEEGLISLEDSTRDLMAQLMREQDRVRVVSIVGMGGLGKTTLAKKVYNKAEVKRHFNCYSWAFISQQFSVNSVLLGILKDVAPQEIGGVKKEKEEKERKKEKIKEEEEEEDAHVKVQEVEDLTSKLYKVLQEKLYLVVFDDIWQIEAWESLKHAFPNGKRGSKILFTTRIKEVALRADPWSSPIELPFLSEKDSWTLFRNKTFPRDIFGENYCISPNLEKLGEEMVRKCGGLPMAIVVLGGLLATKKSLLEWEMVNKNMPNQFIKLDQKQQYGGVYGILALSYNALPWHLKPCFLYFSVFPEDSEIDRKSLVRMWIAEGFVTQSLAAIGSETLEDVGDEYLEDLISRYMIQVSSREQHFDVRHQRWETANKMCRMHDLMRDMCVSKAREEDFLEVVGDHGTRGTVVEAAPNFSSTSRRISIHGVNKSPLHYLSMIEGNVHLRALFYIDPLLRDSSYVSGAGLSLISKNFRLLRVIHIGVNVGVLSSVPREIGYVIHLRYIRWGLDGSLPESVGNLKYLQTLDLRRIFLRSSYSAQLPDVLWKLECLRYLLVDRDDAVSCRVDTLRNLETLRWIRDEFLLKNDAILKLTNLRNLRIVFEKPDNEVEKVLRSPIVELGHLRSLKMVMPKNRPFPELEPISRCHHLSKIDLEGTLKDFHHFSRSQLEHLPMSLTKIVLVESQLMEDPMPILEKLPNLTSLHLLNNVYRGQQMVCSARGFPTLEFLVLYGLSVIDWRVEIGALSNLRTLIIAGLDRLKMIPEGLMFVTTLRLLDVRNMPFSFQLRVRRTGGDDFDKVKHVPHIMFDERIK